MRASALLLAALLAPLWPAYAQDSADPGAIPATNDPSTGDPAFGDPAIYDAEVPPSDIERLARVREGLRDGAAWCVTEAPIAPWDRGWCEAVPPGCDGFAAACVEPAPRGCQESPDLPTQTALPVAEILQGIVITLAVLLVGWAVRIWWLGRDRAPEEAPPEPAAPEVREILDALPPGEDPLATAEAAARAGEIGRALLLLRRAALDALSRASRLVLHPSRTDREYVRALAAQPALAADLRVIVQAVERQRYAGRPVTAAMFAEALAAARRLLSSAAIAAFFAALLSGAGIVGGGIVGAARAAMTSHGMILDLLDGVGYTRLDPASYFGKPGLIFFDATGHRTEESIQEFLQMVDDGAAGVLIADGSTEGLPPGLALSSTCAATPSEGIQSQIGPTAPIRLVRPCWSVDIEGLPTQDPALTPPPKLLATDTLGAPVGWDLPHGEGRLLILGAPGLIDDASVLHQGNAEFLLRLARHTDAWSVGVFEGELISPSPIALLAQAGLLPAAGQGALLFLVACWWRGRRFAQPADPPEARRRDTTEHLRAVAEFYRSHGASRLVLAARARWSLAWMRRRLRADDPQLAALLAARTGAPRERVERILLRAHQAIANPDAPGDEGDLYLEEELWELMDSLRRSARTPTPPTSPASPSASGGWSRR